METKQETTPRRVKIGYNYAQEQRTAAELAAVCEYINEKILPRMAALSLPISKAAALRYAANPAELEADYINGQVKANTPPGATEMLVEVLTDKATARFAEIADVPSGNATTRHGDLLRLDDGRMTYDPAAIREASTRYLTAAEAAQLEAYDRHQAAVKAMNEFFNGKAPDAWSGLREYFWLDNAGHVNAAENVDYSKFTK